mmetsp:Transcript_92132/g.197435  ORF Transcript_92132/g.197435 Transcript_92132/m.197435 type:complete len:264 (+) Transcript_92132:997-1788(+)
MDVADGSEHLPEGLSCCILGQTVRLLDSLEELPALAILHDHKQVIVVLVGSVEPGDARVVEIPQELNLLPKARLLQEGLGHALHSHLPMSDAVFGTGDDAEGTRADLLKELVILLWVAGGVLASEGNLRLVEGLLVQSQLLSVPLLHGLRHLRGPALQGMLFLPIQGGHRKVFCLFLALLLVEVSSGCSGGSAATPPPTQAVLLDLQQCVDRLATVVDHCTNVPTLLVLVHEVNCLALLHLSPRSLPLVLLPHVGPELDEQLH